MTTNKDLENICFDCNNLIECGCVPYCIKELHKTYEIISECNEFDRKKLKRG